MSNPLARPLANISSKMDKVYQAIAEEFANAHQYCESSDYTAEMARELADKFAAIDPAFDKIAFLNVADPD